MHSPLIVGMTVALLFSLGTCFVQKQSVWVNFACTKRLFNLLAETIIKVPNVGLCARCAIFLLKIKQIPSSGRLVKSLHFWREPKVSSRCYWRCLLSWQVLFQRREKRTSWWFCNNSEIHLSLWKVWSLVLCSQSSFYVTRARKNDKNRKNTFFLCWKKMNLVPNKQRLPNVPFQSNKFRKKKLCKANKVRQTIVDVYCLTCRNQKCVYK